MKSETNGGLRFGVKAFVIALSGITMVMLLSLAAPKMRATSSNVQKQQAPVASVAKTNQPVAGPVTVSFSPQGEIAK